MNFTKIPFFALLLVALSTSCSESMFVYQQELQNFINNPDYKLIFDQEAKPEIQAIHRDLVNFTELSGFQRAVRSAFLGLDTVVITDKTMPTLYLFVKNLCDKVDIEQPTIFLTTKTVVYNAAAQKLLMSSGAMIISQKLINEFSDSEIEAVIAHEIGHIRHNHINKNLAIFLCFYLILSQTSYQFNKDFCIEHPLLRFFATNWLASLATSFIVNKQFEREADRFSQEHSHSQGLIDFFKKLQQKELKNDIDLAATYQAIQNFSNNYGDKLHFLIRYYLAQAGNYFDKTYRWLYYNTGYGAHPSPAARIKDAEKFIACQKDSATL